MAMITDEDFRKACLWLVNNGQLSVIGERYVDALQRKVFDLIPNPSPPPEYPNQQIATDITPDMATLESALDSANAEIGVTQQEAVQRSGAKSNLKNLIAGLQGLSAEDKGYAIYCRLMAWRDGATPEVIEGITNRTTAVAYVTSKPEWTNVPSTVKPMLADMMETNAALAQVLLLVLDG